jgi:hypothetical protein
VGSIEGICEFALLPHNWKNQMTARPNAFGEVRAEFDHSALDRAFFAWQDYRTLFESTERFIVVGRRGTGKSALTYQLQKVWGGRKFPLIVIAPTEEQVFGLRPLASLFGQTVMRIRAGIKLAWRYTILMEIASIISSDYKDKAEISSRAELNRHVQRWLAAGSNPIARLRNVLKNYGESGSSEEERIADLASFLDLTKITSDVASAAAEIDKTYVLLVDRLDEGYEPDATGTGLVDGILYGTDEVRAALGKKVRAVVFIRDNIFRAIESEDNDFSRNLESQVLRLHWDQQELFYMVCARIRALFDIQKESDIKVWNAITSNELHGREGFKRCLQHTLYRPRDVIALMNAAFYQAQRQQRDVLIPDDFDNSAKQISDTRFADLGKEYESVFPGVKDLTRAFVGHSAKFSWGDAASVVDRVMKSDGLSQAATQHFKILNSPDEAVKALYGIGFLGVFDRQLGSFVYSHDGRTAGRTLASDDVLMIHPCYWSTLGLKKESLEQADAEGIHDEYDITISSQSSEQRKKLLGQLMSELATIPIGKEGAADFEDWCKRSVEIAFAQHLDNVELKANRLAVQRRDIVATNQATKGVWRRILSDYGSRQIVFEVKNYESIGIDEFRQVHSYLGNEYGRFGIIICRDVEFGLRRGPELEAFKEFYNKGSVIIKLNADQLVTILSKLRNPEKTDAGELSLDKLLDTYIRLYANGQLEAPSKNKKSRRKKGR